MIEEQKRLAAIAALEYIKPKFNEEMIIGVGTGSTVKYFIDLIAEYKNDFKGCVSSSDASTSQLKSLGVAVYDLNHVTEIPYYIDGADEANDKLQLIKGGGAALTREKIIAAASKEFICIVDVSKKVGVLGNFPLPIEVIPLARSYVARKLLAFGQPVYRTGIKTDNGNDIIDLKGLTIVDPRDIETKLNNIVGIVTNGIFAHRSADILFVATNKGIERFNSSII